MTTTRWLAVAVAALACDGARSNDSAQPVAVAEPTGTETAEQPVLDGVEVLQSGLEHSCALRDGTVLCWGHGIGNGAASALAVPVAGLPPIARVKVGGRRVCAVSRDGELFCWGERLGRETTGPNVAVHQPGQTPAGFGIEWGRLARLDYGTKIADVDVGLTHICAVTDKRDLYCWGSNNGRQLEQRSPIDQPQLLASGVDELEVGHGWTCYRAGEKRHCRGSHPRMGKLEQQQHLKWPGWIVASCGVSEDDKVHCEGRVKMVYGGDPMPTEPGGETVPIPGLDQVEQLTVGWAHGCALRADGTVWCWGDDSYGQMLGHAHTRPVPVELPAKARRVEAGMYHTCALLQTGQVACWGRDEHHQSGGDKAVSLIRVAPGGDSPARIETIAMTQVIERYELLGTPSPQNLEGTTWSACLNGCDTCTYTLSFAKKRAFTATSKCPSLGRGSTWTGRYKRAGDVVSVRETPAPSGAVWTWKLTLKGASIQGERSTDGVTYSVTGKLQPSGAR